MEWKDNSIEALEQRVRTYLASAEDKQLTEYLQKLLGRIQNQKHQVQLLSNELDRSLEMYENRRMLADRTTQAIPQTKYYDIQPQTMVLPQTMGQSAAQPAIKQKPGTEFVIGTVLLSIVGGAFVLTALVMLGMYFMSGFVKGMCIYAGAGLLLLVSELILYKRWQKLGKTFSAISIGGLYLATVLNYLTFGNFNMWVTLGITLAITALVIFLAWKRDSLLYRTLGLITCYVSILVMQGDCSMQEIIVLAVIVLVINVMCMVVPLRQHKTGFHLLHIYANGIFVFFACAHLENMEHMVTAQVVWALLAILVQQLLFVLQVRYQNGEISQGRNVGKYGMIAAYFASGLFYYYALPTDLREISLRLNYISFAVVLVLAFGAMLLLRKYKEKWYPYYMINLIAFDVFCMWGGPWEVVIAMVVMVIIAKLLSLLKAPELQVSEMIITVVCCMLCLIYTMPEMGRYVPVLLGAVIFSIPFIRYWQTAYEVLLTFTLAIFVAIKLPSILQLSAFVGIMFVGILLFNNVKRWQGRNIVLFNGLALAGQIICYLQLWNPVYRNAYIVYLCMLIFGLATIVLTFQEKYHMNFRYKNLVLAMFLTYMALVVRTDLSIINSIVMMLIALVCVTWGFYAKEKQVRIYGLVFSLIICGKITLYDFFDAEALQKMILFFTVGVIVLAISGIYIILERRMNIQQNDNGEEQ